MMGGTLYIHAGLAKTGTSAIQGTARDTPIPGLTYPRTGQWPDGAHHILAGFSDPPLPEGAAGLEASFRAELDASTGDMLISSEGLTGKGSLARFLSQYDDRFKTRFDRMIPIIVLRHPLDRIASAYNQTIKEPERNETRDPDAFLTQAGPSQLNAQMVVGWRQEFPDTRFLGHNPASTLVERFFDLIGHPVSGIAPQTRNRSMNGTTLIALLIAKRLLPSPADRTAFFDRLRQDKSQKPWKGETFPFSAAAVSAFVAAHGADEVETIKRLTGVDLGSSDAGVRRRFTLTDTDRAFILRHVEPLPGFEDRRPEFEALIGAFCS